MPKFIFQELVDPTKQVVETARLGAGTGASNYVDDKEVGKFVKLVGESRYNLCVAGDPIEGRIEAVEAFTADDYSIGSVLRNGRMAVTFDGLQATPGTGTVALGDFVVTGTVVAKGTALSAPAKVCKATQQPGVTEASVVGDVNDQLKVAMHPWRVISLGSAGTGAVGTTGIIERV